MGSFSDICGKITAAYFPWIIVLVLLTTLEIVNGRERQHLRSRVAGVSFWMVTILATLLLSSGWPLLWSALGITPLMTLPVFAAVAWSGPLAGVVAVMLAAIVHDFFFYWYHRIQHRWLWRWHAVHHSIEDLNAVNSYHHVSEVVMSAVLLQLPLSLIAADAGPVLPWANMLLWCHVVWIHSPTRLTLGPLRAVFADNRFHRVHHSLEDRHFDRNFGAFTTLWDRLFGTHHAPARGEWPAVGLADARQPTALRDWLDLPLRYRPTPAESTSSVPHDGALATPAI